MDPILICSNSWVVYLLMVAYFLLFIHIPTFFKKKGKGESGRLLIEEVDENGWNEFSLLSLLELRELFSRNESIECDW